MLHIYNLDFLLVSLAVTVLIFFHYRSQPRLSGSVNDRIFLIIYTLGFADILLDIITTFQIESRSGEWRWATILTLTVFYMLQVAVPTSFLCYTISLRQGKDFYRSRLFRAMLVPAALVVLGLVGNLFTGIIFTIDTRGIHVKGPLFFGLYGYAGLCVLAAAVWSVACRKELERKHFQVIWQFIVICVGCISFQIYDYTTLTTGLGICLGVLVLYMSINDPSVHIDQLTGAWDKLRFDQWVHAAVRREQRFHLAVVELYRLKSINALYGDKTGDRILVDVARHLRRVPESRLFRLGSSRFFLVVPGEKEFERLCQGLPEFFRGGFLAESGEVVSCPAVLCAVSDAQTLKESGELVAYQKYLSAQVSPAGKTLFVPDTEKARAGFRYEQEVERYLHTAIEEDLFELHYQPVWSTEEGRYVSLEALSRLRHPKLGMVPPNIFIAIAERSGQIGRISQLQLARLCRFAAEHREEMPGIRNIKYNLSPVELQQENQGQRLVDTVRRSGVDPAFLQFEITESAASERSDALGEAIAAFREAGIRLCLDDFGAGYANLNTVLKMPFSVIKLDRSLLSGICDDPQIAAFYRSIVEVLQHLGYLVVGEGVETREELDLVTGWGVKLVQGFYFSRPLPAAEILETIKQA